MSKEALDALRARVAEDPALARRLHAIAPERFVEGVTAAAAKLGCDVEPTDLLSAIADGRHAWTVRWVR